MSYSIVENTGHQGNNETSHQCGPCSGPRTTPTFQALTTLLPWERSLMRAALGIRLEHETFLVRGTKVTLSPLIHTLPVVISRLALPVRNSVVAFALHLHQVATT